MMCMHIHFEEKPQLPYSKKPCFNEYAVAVHYIYAICPLITLLKRL